MTIMMMMMMMVVTQHASDTKRCYSAPATKRRCSEAGNVTVNLAKSNGSLPTFFL